MTPITKTRSQAIAEIKQIVYRAINKKRYNFTMMEETSSMCDCGQTQAIYFEYYHLKQWHPVKVGYCENCGTDTSKGRIHA